MQTAPCCASLPQSANTHRTTRNGSRDNLQVSHPSVELGCGQVIGKVFLQRDVVQVMEKGVVDKGQWMSHEDVEEECAGPFGERKLAQGHCRALLTVYKQIEQALKPTMQGKMRHIGEGGQQSGCKKERRLTLQTA